MALVLSMVRNHPIYTIQNSYFFFLIENINIDFFIQIPVLIGLIFFLHSYCKKKIMI